MEIPRTLFAVTGKHAGVDFEDFRFDFPAFGAAQKSGELGAENMNRVPLLVHNGTTIGQGPSICRYLARNLGLFGTTESESAIIDNICEHITETGTAFGKVMPYGNDFTASKKAEVLDKWFDTAADVERADRAFRWHLAHVEKMVGADGYSFGTGYTLADAKIYNAFGDVCLLASGVTSHPFGAEEGRCGKVLSEEFPKVFKIVETFKNSPGMKKYLDARGVQGF